jgi:hypothetical protein
MGNPTTTEYSRYGGDCFVCTEYRVDKDPWRERLGREHHTCRAAGEEQRRRPLTRYLID